jgi:two-component system, NtrC family, sensor kinase
MKTRLHDNSNHPERVIADLRHQLAERTAERDEALVRETATAEVLQVINSSPGDFAPVFQAVLERATNLCEAKFGVLWAYEGDEMRAAAVLGVPPQYAEFIGERRPLTPTHQRLRLGERIIQIVDVPSYEGYRDGLPLARALVDLGGVRTILMVPLLRQDTPIGAFCVYRQEAQRFSDRQVALLQQFASQAVIAVENARLLTETRETLEQQIATAEVLQAINSSPGDLTPVFETILEKAHSLCGVASGTLQLYDGEKFRAAAVHGLSEPHAEWLRQGYHPGPNLPQTRLLAGDRLAHVADMTEIDDPNARTAVALGHIRTLLCVALHKDDTLLGMITATRFEVSPFTDKEIALLQNFAAQAVIAMENARLITETREALDQQTATAEVLRVINSSPGDLAPVFDAMLEKAMRLCEAQFGFLSTYDGEHFDAVALHGLPEGYVEQYLTGPYLPGPNTTHDRLVRGELVVHVPDLAVDTADSPRRRAVVDVLGVRSILAVPLRKDGALLGAFHAYRQEVRPYSDKQVALLQNFAAQAVIAMENARLLGELRRRTADLQESLGYQTATSDVLKVISGSTFDVQPVFETISETATRLCDADFALFSRREGDAYRVVATFAFSSEFDAFIRGRLLPTGRGSLSSRVAAEGQVVHIDDVADDPDYAVPETVTLARARTVLGVPLLREGAVIGVIALARKHVQPFAERQIELVRTFADQAVIAIENARLLEELRQRTEEVATLNRVSKRVSPSRSRSWVVSGG